jgi:hypothetical protein
MNGVYVILMLIRMIILSVANHGSAQRNLHFYDLKKEALQTFRHRFLGPNSDTIGGLPNLKMIEEELEIIDEDRLMWYLRFTNAHQSEKKRPDIH